MFPPVNLWVVTDVLYFYRNKGAKMSEKCTMCRFCHDMGTGRRQKTVCVVLTPIIVSWDSDSGEPITERVFHTIDKDDFACKDFYPKLQ